MPTIQIDADRPRFPNGRPVPDVMTGDEVADFLGINPRLRRSKQLARLRRRGLLCALFAKSFRYPLHEVLIVAKAVTASQRPRISRRHLEGGR